MHATKCKRRAGGVGGEEVDRLASHKSDQYGTGQVQQGRESSRTRSVKGRRFYDDADAD